MASAAHAAFDSNAKDVERLLEIHADIGGDAQGRRFGLEVLNKSAVVLITAIWEAYCEDIASEALEHLVAHAPSATALPAELRKRISTEIKKDPNELAMWELADKGWQDRTRARLAALTVERNRKLNSPKAQQIDDLFASAIGLTNVSAFWRWRRMPSNNAREKLDRYVALRGDIAHRGAAAAGVMRAHVTDYFQHVRQLVTKTGDRVNAYVNQATGVPLW